MFETPKTQKASLTDIQDDVNAKVGDKQLNIELLERMIQDDTVEISSPQLKKLRKILCDNSVEVVQLSTRKVISLVEK